LKNAALGAVAFGVAYLPQLASYEALNGYPGPSRLVARKLTWTAPHAFGVLASPEHGLLFWTPLTALSLIGLEWLALESRRPQSPYSSASDHRQRRQSRGTLRVPLPSPLRSQSPANPQSAPAIAGRADRTEDGGVAQATESAAGERSSTPATGA